MTIAQAFNDIAVAHGGTASASGTIAGAIDALNDALAGSDQQAASTIEGAVRLLGNHIGGSTPTGTIEITENGEGIDVTQYAYADVNVSGGSSDLAEAEVTIVNNSSVKVSIDGAVIGHDEIITHTSCESGDTAVIGVVLFKGYGYISVYDDNDTVALSVTGSLDEDEGSVDVTGDGTITVTDA